MCGIAGFAFPELELHFTKDEARDILGKMCRSIRYRGPDDEGFSLFGFDDNHRRPKTGLGHNRLSIIDLTAAGRQPMTNEDQSVWVSYNGEIYNFQELKECLIQLGHRFRSMSDTEVILHAWEEWGQECVNKFNGMFAFALWDESRGLLMLARDRMGKKPVYYSLINNGIVFASEPKAILEFPSFIKEIDNLSLKKYLLFEYVPSPHTIYKNIKRLEAGNLLIWKSSGIKIKKYWDIPFTKTAHGRSAEALHDLLKDSAGKRLMSDVPLGVFLSGGIDSSAITAVISEILPLGQIKTFTIGFDDKSFDESKNAKAVADYFGTTHFEKILEPRAMLEILPEIFNFLDEPFADASIVPTYLLSKFTREHVKVALGGDGGDELFAGYDTFQAHRLAMIYEKIPRFLKKHIFEKIVYNLPVSFDNMSFDFKIKQFLKGIPYPKEIRNQVWLGSFAPDEQEDLLQPDILRKKEQDNIFEDIYASLAGCGATNYIDFIIYLYCKFYLQDDILTKVDRASMACSLEVRAPFLDYRFVEFVCGLPAHLKLKGLKTKYILKKAMSKTLPAYVIRRPKKGFGIPIAKWINNEMKDLVSDELAVEKIRRENLFVPSQIQRLLKEHFKGERDNRKQLWTLLMFELWYKKWFKSS